MTSIRFEHGIYNCLKCNSNDTIHLSNDVTGEKRKCNTCGHEFIFIKSSLN